MTPEDDDPYARGIEAHDAGFCEAENPYDPIEQEGPHLAWNDGWLDAAEAGEAS